MNGDPTVEVHGPPQLTERRHFEAGGLAPDPEGAAGGHGHAALAVDAVVLVVAGGHRQDSRQRPTHPVEQHLAGDVDLDAGLRDAYNDIVPVIAVVAVLQAVEEQLAALAERLQG